MKNSENNSPGAEEVFVPQHLPDQGSGHSRLGMVVAGLLATLLLVGGSLVLLANTVSITSNAAGSQIKHLGGLSILNGNTLYGFAGEHRLEVSADGYATQQVSLTISENMPPTFGIELVELPGLISFELSGPDSGDLYLDGTLVGEVGLNPVEIDRGSVEYRIEHPRYLPAEGTLEVNGFGAKQSVAVTLAPNWRTVSLNSEPADASVYQNDALLGQTPLTIDLLPNLYVLSFKKDGFAEARQLLEIDLGPPLIADEVTLEPLGGSLKIASTPPGGRVFIDDIYAGTSPLTFAAVADKNYVIRIEKDGYDRWDGDGSVASNGTTEISASLEQQFGTLDINNSPVAAVYLNGEPQGVAPLEIRLPVDTYEVELRLPGYRAIRRQVAIMKNEHHQIDVTLLTEKEARYAEAKPIYRAPSGINMVLAKPSTFKMGAPRGEPGQMANEIEKIVTMERWFYIAETEVTYSQFNAFSREMAGSILALRGISGTNPNHPVTGIDWQTAARYCNWLSSQEGLPAAYKIQDGKFVLNPSSIGYRLPTEAEWEWSARVAGRVDSAQNKYPWGNGATVPPGAGNFADTSASATLPHRIPKYSDGFPKVAPAGSFAANPMGVFDLGGNVSEWVHDYYGIELAMPGQSFTDPTGPENGLDHVVKGSSWRSGNETELRYSFRTNGDGPTDYIGFRVARWVH